MWGRATAGILAGFPLAAALSGLIAAALPLGFEAGAVLVVVLLLPMWVGVICASFLAPAGWRAWGWLIALNALAYALLWGARASGMLVMPA